MLFNSLFPAFSSVHADSMYFTPFAENLFHNSWSSSSLIIAFAKSFSFLCVSKPVLLCSIDSLSPPSFTPTTGVPQAIASSGTYPNGSRYGAYTTSFALLYSLIRSSSDIWVSMSSSTLFSFASVFRYSIHSWSLLFPTITSSGLIYCGMFAIDLIRKSYPFGGMHVPIESS